MFGVQYYLNGIDDDVIDEGYGEYLFKNMVVQVMFNFEGVFYLGLFVFGLIKNLWLYKFCWCCDDLFIKFQVNW